MPQKILTGRNTSASRTPSILQTCVKILCITRLHANSPMNHSKHPHIYVTCIVILCGDFAQQQPTLLHHPLFFSFCTQTSLTHQFRIDDDFLLHFLSHIRYYIPISSLLSQLQDNKILSSSPITEQAVLHAAASYPAYLFLTVSNAASTFINNTIISSHTATPVITTVLCTPDRVSTSLFAGMPIMLLENRDKASGFVNGQICTIYVVAYTKLKINTRNKK